MPRSCSICSTRDRQAIDTALLAGIESLRSIGRHFNVGKNSLIRHRAHMPARKDPLTEPISTCPIHGNTPFRLEAATWICSRCHSWDGRPAYFKYPWPPVTATPPQ